MVGLLPPGSLGLLSARSTPSSGERALEGEPGLGLAAPLSASPVRVLGSLWLVRGPVVAFALAQECSVGGAPQE
jgi:hypothetical protein